MLRCLAAVLMALAVPTARNEEIQTAPPSTDVFLASFARSGDTFRVGSPENISKSPGYDNQPFFAPDGTSLYFTSDRAQRPAEKASQPSARQPVQMEIFKYDVRSSRISQVTSTPESEYSPTVTPDRQHLSVIRVEADGTQRLWRFGLDGQNPALVLQDVKPVGYHAWLDDNTVVLFVLGRPATLQVADVKTGKAEAVTENIGQSIQKIPGGGVSFVQQTEDGEALTLTITQVTKENGKVVTKPLTPAVKGARQAHVAWTPDGTLLMAHGGTLHAWKPGQAAWQAAADLTRLGLRNVTRLAVSPSGDRIALVATP